MIESFFAFLFNGVHQYLGVGPYVFGFVEIASLSFLLLSVAYVRVALYFSAVSNYFCSCFNSLPQYQAVYPREYPTTVIYIWMRLIQGRTSNNEDDYDGVSTETDAEADSEGEAEKERIAFIINRYPF